jgi:hypothetical protein
MFIRNTVTQHEGLWLKTEEKCLVVWNTDLNSREEWQLENTECVTNTDVPGHDFVELLEHLTSDAALSTIEDSNMVYAIKSISFYMDSGLFAKEKNVQKMIETLQEVLYYVCGSKQLSKERDEILLFIHQKIPSLFLGAYWGYKLAQKLKFEPEPEAETKSEPKLETEPETLPKPKSFWSFCRCRYI